MQFADYEYMYVDELDVFIVMTNKYIKLITNMISFETFS